LAAHEPPVDGFRNHKKGPIGAATEALLIGKAQLLSLTAPEMTALVGGLRVLGAYAQEYPSADGQQKCVANFVAAWTTVMNLDRFDLA
jgi:catalase (peroxidase I)